MSNQAAGAYHPGNPRTLLALGCAILLLPYLPLLLAGRTFIAADCAHFEVPMLTFLRENWGQSWYPWTEGGLPVAGYTLGRLLYPPQLFFAAIPPLSGTLAYFLLHQLLAFGFAWLYLRSSLKARPLPALLGALAYAGSSARVHFAINFVFYPILTLAPLLLFLLEWLLRRPGPRPALGLSVTLALVLSGGGWQLTAVTLANMAWYFLLTHHRRRSPRALVWAAVAGALALAWTAPVSSSLKQLYGMEVIRSVPFEPSLAGQHGLQDRLGWEAFFDPFWGNLEELDHRLGFNSHEFPANCGLALLPLACVGLAPRKGRRRWVLAWGTALALDAFFSFGYANPVYRWLQHHVPLVANFREPIRLLTPFPLLWMGLVTFGAERLPVKGRGLLAFLIAYVALFVLQGRSFGAPLLLLSAVTGWAAVRTGRRGWLLAAALCQVGTPVLFVQEQFFWTSETTRQEIALLTDLKKQVPNPLVGVFYALNPESPALVGLRSAAGFSPFMLKRHADYLFVALHGREMTSADYQRLLLLNFHPLDMLQEASPDAWDRPMTRMLCLAFLVRPEAVAPLNLSYPGFWFSRKAVGEPDDARARALLLEPSFRPEDTVVLPERVVDPPFTPGSARLTAYEPSRMTFDLGGQSGWLTVCGAHYPGWKARVDGQPVPLYRGNTLFLTVPVPAGARQLTLEFRDEPFQSHLPWLGGALLGWLVLALLSWARQPRRAVL